MEIIAQKITLPPGEYHPEYHVFLPPLTRWQTINHKDMDKPSPRFIAVYEYWQDLGKDGVVYQFAGVTTMFLPVDERKYIENKPCSCEDKKRPYEIMYRCSVCGGFHGKS